MGRLTNLNPAAPIADADLPASIARDAEFIAADTAHVNATDPHLQYPTQARGDARYVRKYSQYFRAAPSISQEIPQDIVTKINFDTITHNVGNQYSSVNNRLLALESEIWRITTNVNFTLPSASRVILFLAKNGGGGTSLKRLQDISCPAGFFAVNITPADTPLLAGEYLEVWARILTIATGKVYGDTNLNACWWEGSRVG